MFFMQNILEMNSDLAVLCSGPLTSDDKHVEGTVKKHNEKHGETHETKASATRRSGFGRKRQCRH